MSYILDALRKAEAERERERGHVPGLHAQQPVPGTLPPGRPPAGSARWAWIGGGAVLVVALAAGLAWWWSMARAPSASAPVPAVALAAPTASAAVPVTTTPPLPATAPAPIAQAPVRKPKPASAAEPARGTEPALPAVAANADSSGPLPGKIYALAELPNDVRSQLPKLTIGGSMYSPVRADRVLIVNGQAAKEGATIAPGLVLDQVRVKSAVLLFKGYRYNLPF
jgi:general secretion pathway protein B